MLHLIKRAYSKFKMFFFAKSRINLVEKTMLMPISQQMYGIIYMKHGLDQGICLMIIPSGAFRTIKIKKHVKIDILIKLIVFRTTRGTKSNSIL